jgi:hypothetical protein
VFGLTLAVAVLATVFALKLRHQRDEATRLRRQADEHARAARTQSELAVDAMFTLAARAQDRLQRRPELQALRAELLDEAVAVLGRIERSSDNSALVDRGVAIAHQRMGDLLRDTGRTADAVPE